MDIILLIFLTWHIGKKVREKRLDVFKWRLRLVLTWLVFEIGGGMLGIMLFGFDKDDLLGLAAFALACAFGGYLLIRFALDKIPGPVEDDINNSGSN